MPRSPLPQMSEFAEQVYRSKYMHPDDGGWGGTAGRVATHPMAALGYRPGSDEVRSLVDLVRRRAFMPGGRYLATAGAPFHQVNNCLLLRAEDTREGWADLWRKAGMASMTGAGIGVDYSDIREYGAPLKRTGGEASGPIPLMKSVNELGRAAMQGGRRRSAIWAGLSWRHPDVLDFVRVKDWSPGLRALKAEDLSVPMPMEYTNVSVQLDDEFFRAIYDGEHPLHHQADLVYWTVVDKMATTGEPGFSVDTGPDAGETLRNACTELTSRDDSDVCNLGSLNLAEYRTLGEFEEAVALGTLFLLSGSVYSDLPYPEVGPVRERNRRLGLGLMGVHEWLALRGKPYGPDPELGRWLDAYERSTDLAAGFADQHGLSRPVKTRAIAPTGTIAIIAETTSGMEPIFCKAYKRLLKEADAGGLDRTKAMYVVDPTARKLAEAGVDPNEVEDAYQLSYDVDRRLGMQAWLQGYVDHGISSTVNLPGPLTGQDQRDFGRALLMHLPRLRGVTAYPDGARDGQPLNPVPYDEAVTKQGVVFEESDARCVSGSCGA